MKFFHLADLHLGRRLNDYSLIEEQSLLLDEVLREADEKRPDCVLIAGDVFDRAIAPEEAIRLFESFLLELAKRSILVFVIAGNHDSGARLSQYAKLLETQGIYIHGHPEEGVHTISREIDGQTYDFYLLPYIFPAQIRSLMNDETLHRFDQGLHALISQIELDPNHKSILLSHQFYQGEKKAERTDSERIMIGGLENAGITALKKFDYVALGHLHRAQKAGKEHIRYPGSMMKYSFSEKQDEKGFLFGEFLPEGLKLETIALHAKKNLVDLKGTFDELMDPAKHTEDYVRIFMTKSQGVYEAAARLRENYPYLVELIFEDLPISERPLLKEINLEEKGPEEMIEVFYESKTGEKMNENKQKIVRSIFSQITGERDEAK